MPIKIIRNDITQVTCDAIVNAAKNSLMGGGGVDGAIHAAAGRELLEECMTLGGCPTGQARITKGYRLPAKYVIHTVGPVWQGGSYGEKGLLESCYRESMKLAIQNDCETVAFPLISSGIYGYPKDQALRVAMDTISQFLLEHDLLVYIVVFDKSAYQIGNKLYADIATYIDDHYAESIESAEQRRRRAFLERHEKEEFPDAVRMPRSPQKSAPESYSQPLSVLDTVSESISYEMSLDDILNQVDESFTQMLLRKIDEKGMKDSECYKRANVDRKLFSKIRSDLHYHPKKTTAIAFAIALELSLEETRDLLMKAGFALSHSSKFDLIIEYFIKKGNYDIMQINEALFAFDQVLLGA